MKWVYSNVNSVFLTILICTVVLRGITIFSDIATRKSQAKMNGIQPELAKIQKKFCYLLQNQSAKHMVLAAVIGDTMKKLFLSVLKSS